MRPRPHLYFSSSPAVHHMNKAPSVLTHGVPFRKTQHLAIRTSPQYHVDTEWIARGYLFHPEMARLISTGYRHVGPLHEEPISGTRWCGTSRTWTRPTAGLDGEDDK